MLKIICSSEARSDLREIVRYVAERDPDAAHRLRQLFTNSALSAAECPGLFRVDAIALFQFGIKCCKAA